MFTMEDRLRAALTQRRKDSRLRQHQVIERHASVRKTVAGRELISFSSNDYLGLAQHPQVVAAGAAALKRWGTGSGASHLVDGHTAEHHALEEELAAFLGRERALVFSTGYMANLGVMQALLGRALGQDRTSVIQDKLNHASLIDAAHLSGAKLIRYAHNNTEHLQQRLNNDTSQRRLVAVDGVFSMDGDTAPLADIAPIAKQNDAWLMVDDAHGIGVLGKSGGGTLEEQGISPEDAPVLMGTCGKALGTFGAFVAGSHALIDTLIQFSRTYIYTTAIPPSVAAATRESVRLLSSESWRRERLLESVNYFSELLRSLLNQFSEQRYLTMLPSRTAIQPLVVGKDSVAMAISKALRERGFWVTAIRPPTVPQGTARLRFTLSAEHTREQIDGLIAALNDALRENRPSHD